jgi:hypothetical protein
MTHEVFRVTLSREAEDDPGRINTVVLSPALSERALGLWVLALFVLCFVLALANP